VLFVGSESIQGLLLTAALPTMANADDDVKPIPAPVPAERKRFTIPGGGAFRPNVRESVLPFRGPLATAPGERRGSRAEPVAGGCSAAGKANLRPAGR
jgi:hypothetical protein